jgi:hypothetical protein
MPAARNSRGRDRVAALENIASSAIIVRCKQQRYDLRPVRQTVL